jgi:hypothetical protein
MARIAHKLQAFGFESETCAACERQFERGEIMTAVVAEAGTPLGWFCAACLDEWRADSKRGSD